MHQEWKNPPDKGFGGAEVDGDIAGIRCPISLY